MKIFKRTISVCIVATMLTLPSLSFAGGNSGEQIINQIKVGQGGTIQIWGNLGNWNNPDTCNSTNFIVMVPFVGNVENKYYSEMYALLAASYLQGKSVSGFLGGCLEVNGLTYPILRNIQSKQ